MSTTVNDLNLAILGNGRVSALVNSQGAIVWCCFPRFDGDPVFNALLHSRGTEDTDAGFFAIELLDLDHVEQHYLENTAILITQLWDSHGSGLEIVDFMPRFFQNQRCFQPASLMRRIRPIEGAPRIRVHLKPRGGWSNQPATMQSGSNHIVYNLGDQMLRVTTSMSLSMIRNGSVQVIDRAHNFLLSQNVPLEASLDDTTQHFLQQTTAYWREWVRNLYVPFEWQEEVIRAAITLKLSAFDDTGAIVAAMTTSIPEAANSQRNWDYRFCWVRDAYFVINALNRLGKTTTMENYVRFLINVVANNKEKEELQPLFSIDGDVKLDELTIDTLPGYRGMGPVRVGNGAYTQRQNDTYGSIILAAAHAFVDRRLRRDYFHENSALFKTLELMGEKAYRFYKEPDAGLWEFRTTSRVHTYSSLICWAGCDRLAKIAGYMQDESKATYWRRRADEIRAAIEKHAWSDTMNSYMESFGGSDFDASMLLMAELGFLKPDNPRFVATVAAIEKHLKRGDFVFRYTKRDDFGEPDNAFLVCTFWYINALALMGRKTEARALFEKLLKCRNPHGLLSEDVTTDGKELWGNFPQTYSMVGLINAALHLSKRWEDAF